jgi:twitching motility protein PilT
MLLEPLLDPERERVLAKDGVAELVYDAPGAGRFHAVIKLRASDPGDLTMLDVVLARGEALAAGPSAAGSPPTGHAARSSDPEPAERFIALLERAVALRASDLHLCEGQTPTVRIDGGVRPMHAEPVASLAQLVGGSLAEGIRAASSSGRSVDLAFEAAGTGRFRVNLYVASGRPCASVRILPSTVPALPSLQLPVPLDDLVDMPHGLVLVCGPTGSGKSTTLASLAQEAVRRRNIVLITLEDPIELRLDAGARGSLVRQREVGRDVLDFPTGLRDALREDPDMLLVGEMRDAESIGLALTAAETGHLVLASLHSRSAASAIDRIVDTYAPERNAQVRIQLADSLRAVVSQRLLPRASGPGRVVAVEVLRNNYNVAALIREDRTAQIATVMQSGRKEGQLPLERCLADLVRSGQASLEDARAVANDPVAFASYMQG